MPSETDISRTCALHLRAFGDEEGPVISEMVAEMLADDSTISIDAVRDGRQVGNVLFTRFHLDDHPEKTCYLLAPIGVEPELQGALIGKELIDEGVRRLEELDTDAIFVLGWPRYYGMRGFFPTWVIPPFHDTVKRIDAWKMRELRSGSMAEVGGQSQASDAIMKPHFWNLSREN